MSKKVFKWMIADLVFVGIITLLFLWIKNGIISVIPNDTVRNSTNVVLWVLYGIVDLVVLFWFLLYWWSDCKWKQLKSWANRKFKLR